MSEKLTVTPEQITEWKTQYKKVFLSDGGIYFRTLKRSEYVTLLSKQAANPSTFDWEAEVSKTCILSGITEEDLDNESGLATVLAEQILVKSGFSQIEVEEI